MDEGLSIGNELFAIRLLELARHLSPQGNRVKFVHFCEAQEIRGFLEGFPDLWQRITDDPPREGILPSEKFVEQGEAQILELASLEEELGKLFQSEQLSFLSLGGLSSAKRFYSKMALARTGRPAYLVSPKDASRAYDLLTSQGYLPTEPTEMSEAQEQALRRYGRVRTFRHSSRALSLDLCWRPFSPWIGSDLLPFEELWERRQTLHLESLTWQSLSGAHTIVYLALSGFEDGWSKLKQFLELAVALERLDYTWDEVLATAGPRAVLVERAVELVVRLLGLPHPSRLTHHYRDYERALESWTQLARADQPPRSHLLKPNLWSCGSGEAILRSAKALFNPTLKDLERVSLPEALLGLYPLLRGLSLLKKALLPKSLID